MLISHLSKTLFVDCLITLPLFSFYVVIIRRPPGGGQVMEVAPAEDETLCSSAVTAVRWGHTTQCSHWVDALCSYAHISGYLCRKWMGCLSCQVVSIHYAKFLQQNINAAAWLHSEHRALQSSDAVSACTLYLYLSMDPNITQHTHLKTYLSARQCFSSITQNYGEGKLMSHGSFDFARLLSKRMINNSNCASACFIHWPTSA